MPGPMSSPNGVASVTAQRDPNKRIVSGKTAVKRKGTESARMKQFRESLAALRAQEED